MSAVAWLGHQRGTASWRLRTALAALVAVLMGLNAIGCYGFLAKAHIEHQVEGDVAVAGRAADTKARLAVQAEKVADLTKQIADLDAAGPSRRTPPAIYGPLRPSTHRRQHWRQPPGSAPRMMSAGRPSAPALPTSLRLRRRPSPRSRSRRPRSTATGRSRRPIWARSAIWQRCSAPATRMSCAGSSW